MRVHVRKWGNSLALRIPKPLAEEARLKRGTGVDLSVADGKLVAVPVWRVRVTLGELLQGVRKRHLHGEVDFRKPVGREIW